MFGLFRKKKKKEGQEAFEAGQMFAREATATLERFIGFRFVPLHIAYLDTLRSRLREAITQTEHPPGLFGKVAVDSFDEDVRKLKAKMSEETYDLMAEWINLCDETRAGNEVRLLIDVRIHDFTMELTKAGATILDDYAKVLTDADDAWCTANPEKAAAFYNK